MRRILDVCERIGFHARGLLMFRFGCLWLFAGVALLAGCAGLGPSEEAAATPVQPGEEAGTGYVEYYAGLRMEMVWVPGGTFWMGSRLSADEVARRYGGPGEGFDDEHPIHTVTLDGFWIGKCEVTNEQFRRFLADHDSGAHEGHTLNDDNQPAVELTWEEAKAFCDWLSRETGKNYTLPSEAQWEYACRAGTDTVRFWGDDDESMGRYANTADRTAESVFGDGMRNRRDYSRGFIPTTDGHEVASPVGSFEPNQLGLHDMIGNVIEYCLDWYAPDFYEHGSGKNPINLAVSEKRCCRGGSWLHLSFMQRSAYRGNIWMDHRSARVGFRVARNMSEVMSSP